MPRPASSLYATDKYVRTVIVMKTFQIEMNQDFWLPLQRTHNVIKRKLLILLPYYLFLSMLEFFLLRSQWLFIGNYDNVFIGQVLTEVI